MASYLGRFKAISNPNFYGRVWMAAYKVAEDVQNEDPNTPNHAARADLAVRLQINPEQYAALFVRAAAMHPTVGGTIDDTGLATAADGDIQTVIAGMWDRATTQIQYLPR